MNLEWEEIGSDRDNEYTKRLKVFGGWLVLTTVSFDRYLITQSFVPDPNHEWE
jgi:hypothetical protein